MKKEVDSKNEVTLSELLFYNVLFFVPILISIYITNLLGKKLSLYWQVSPAICSHILMVPFTLLIFFLIIPYIRKRENVSGVRYALIAFLIVGIFMTIPSALKGFHNVFFRQLIYLAGYVLLTFIYAPEVLGMRVDIMDWFKHSRQLIILFVYVFIVMFYVMGFGMLYYEIYLDQGSTAFAFDSEKTPGYPTFLYYSIVTFTTIGYGDITPLIPAARFVVGFEAMLGAIINVVFIAILLVYVSTSTRRIYKEEKKIIKEEKTIEEEEADIKRRLAEIKRMKKGKKRRR